MDVAFWSPWLLAMGLLVLWISLGVRRWTLSIQTARDADYSDAALRHYFEEGLSGVVEATWAGEELRVAEPDPSLPLFDSGTPHENALYVSPPPRPLMEDYRWWWNVGRRRGPG